MGDVVRVLFGTETGTAEMCASDLVDTLKKKGWPAKLVDMDDQEADALADERLVVVITATFGNGDPPANAEHLLESLREQRPDLSGMPYAVLALGDSSYPRFAQCGKDFFAIFGELGGEAVIDRVDCDGDVDVPFSTFQKKLVAFLEANPDRFPRGEVTEEPRKGMFARLKSWFGGNEPEPAAAPATPPAPTAPAKQPAKVDRHNPASGKLVETLLLSREGSSKETRHYVLEVGANHGVRAGDSIGVYPRNAPALVDAVLEAIGADGATNVQGKKGTVTLRQALEGACLRRVTPKLLESLGKGALVDGDPEALQAWIDDHHVLHTLREHGELDPQTLVDGLHPLAPRLYSVANDSRGSDRIDLVIETTRYTFKGVETCGVASCWFADQLGPGDAVPWYPHPNRDFHRPDGVPLILIGPGTGLAPFRGFLQEIANEGVDQRAWLFFGHRNHAYDDLYGDELQGHLDSGVLNRITHAWSRDQDAKIYVQDRIREQGDELWSWLSDGAVVFVCGAAVGMAPGVRDAFAEIATKHGEDGAAWLERRIDDGLYREDVY